MKLNVKSVNELLYHFPVQFSFLAVVCCSINAFSVCLSNACGTYHFSSKGQRSGSQGSFNFLQSCLHLFSWKIKKFCYLIVQSIWKIILNANIYIIFCEIISVAQVFVIHIPISTSNEMHFIMLSTRGVHIYFMLNFLLIVLGQQWSYYGTAIIL